MTNRAHLGIEMVRGRRGEVEEAELVGLTVGWVELAGWVVGWEGWEGSVAGGGRVCLAGVPATEAEAD